MLDLMRPSKLISPTFVVVAAILGGVALSLNQCHAAVIDLFDDPDSPERYAVRLGPFTDVRELPASVFETRTIELHTLSSVSNSLPVAETLVISDSQFAYDNPALDHTRLSCLPSGAWEVSYQTSSPVNLLGDGATTLRLEIASIAIRRPSLFFQSEGGARGFYLPIDRPFEATGPLTVDIPFTSFEGVDFGSVTEFRIRALRSAPETHFILDSITTVPEPSFPILSSLSLSLLAFSRRRSSCSQNSPDRT